MDAPKEKKEFFTRQLMAWHENFNDRELPWKNETDPYKIWLSEIILQQTRAQQGLPFYNRFVNKYRTIVDLANADEEEIFKLWQGLGYYNRCKNLIATAKEVTEEHNGIFPKDYNVIRALKGIGPYTAAAITSFAYNMPHAVVDGNVIRLIARFFGIEILFDTTIGKQYFEKLAGELLDKENSKGYNQAIMDFGATVCVPKKPKCNTCPLSEWCVAFRNNIVSLLPVKSKKIVLRKRFFHYIILKHENEILIHKRQGSDIWENLHEPLLFEATEVMDLKKLRKCSEFVELKLNGVSPVYLGGTSQRLTHQIIEAHFFEISLKNRDVFNKKDYFWATKDDLRKKAFPKKVFSFLDKMLYF